jgi:uncharacterized DUF497 family protein
MQYNFDWDPAKVKQNLRKHGVSFERAAMIFRDPLFMMMNTATMKIVGLQ